MEFVLLYLVYGVVLGSFCAYLAGQKGRDGTSWFFLGLVFGILALLVLIGLPGEQHSSSENRPHTRPPVTSSTDRNVTGKTPDVRLCPHCIQEVHELAAACPHCQRDLPEVERCSLPSCRKIINQTDDRCEDGQENTFCGDLHRQQYVGPRQPHTIRGYMKCDRCGVEILASDGGVDVLEKNMSVHDEMAHRYGHR